MCNLSQGIWETAEAAGRAYEEITKISGMTKEQIRRIEEDSMANV